MSRYFFHLQGMDHVEHDLVGRDLADAQSVKDEAARIAAQFDTAEKIGGMLDYQWIEVLDDAQRPVMRLPLSHVTDEPSRSH